MASTFTTGFKKVADGGYTNIDLSAYSNLVSARIRWRDRSEQLTTESSPTTSSDFGETPILHYLTPPTAPYGWSFYSTKIEAYLYNKHPVAQNLALAVGYDGSHYSSAVGSAVPYNSSIYASYEFFSGYESSVYAIGDVTPISGDPVTLNMSCTTTYKKNNPVGSPQVIISGQTTAYSGNVPTGTTTAWQTLTGLQAGQNNSIRHDFLNSTYVDVDIEYTVSLAPTVVTQDASDISYEEGTINGVISDEGLGTATGYLQYGSTESFGTTENLGEVTEGTPFSYEITGLDYGETVYYRAYATNSDGTSYGATKSFTTLYPTLEAPTRTTLTNSEKVENRRPYFTFTLNENTDNDATKYHARIRFSEYQDMSSPTVYQSSVSQLGWELWDSVEEEWIAFPSEGVDPDSIVRYRPLSNLDFKTYYWDCASNDQNNYGTNSSAWSFRVMLSTDGAYILIVNSIEYNVYSLNVLQASNGEVGGIEFELNNNNGATNTAIQWNHSVNLAIKDVYGNTEEYIGKVRSKQVSGYALKVTAILGDGVLSERRVKEDYTSQDIGLIVEDIIDTYCAGLTSTNVNTSTGISAPIVGTDKTPLAILEELRKQYGIFYYVDKDWDVHFYLDTAISSSFVTVKHGGWT